MTRRLPLFDQPQETRFFVFVGGFGLVLAATYWALTAEVAGTVLLAGFGVGAGLIGIALVRARPRAVAIAAAARRQAAAADLPGTADPEALDASTGGTLGVDTPFADASGRLPGESLAPLSLGLGIALCLTAVVFGPWLLIAGVLPAAWGAWTWLSGARAELDATVDHEP